jgi:hypothetical protein
MPLRLICFIIFLTATPLYAQDVKCLLSQLPEQDRDVLNRLFYQLMNDDFFSYTLFGDKPLSLSGEFVLTPYQNTLSGLRSGGVFWKQWAIWKKHENKFPIKNYLFIEEPSLNCQNVVNIFFINKKAFLQTVTLHLDTFRQLLGYSLTADSLLEKIEKERCFIKNINYSERLLGILLGYGDHNAKLYCRRHHLRKFIVSQTMPRLPEKIPSPSKNFSSIEEECKFLHQKLSAFEDHNYSPLVLPPIQFAADRCHLETKQFKQKYARLRGNISSLYAQSSDSLELILTQMTAN